MRNLSGQLGVLKVVLVLVEQAEEEEVALRVSSFLSDQTLPNHRFRLLFCFGLFVGLQLQKDLALSWQDLKIGRPSAKSL